MPALSIQYKDFAFWQSKQKVEQQKIFWLKVFKDIPERLKLPVDFYAAKRTKSNGDTYQFELSNHKLLALKTICRSEEVSLFTLISSTFYILLSRVSNQNDFVVGLSTHGRQHTDIFDLIGVFINTLPIRVKVDQKKNFREFLHTYKHSMTKYFANQGFSYDLLLDELRKKQLIGNDPLFNVMFEYHNYDWKDIKSSTLQLEKVNIPNPNSRFDISLIVIEKENKMAFNLDYSKDLFKRSSIEKLIYKFENLLEEVTSSYDTSIFNLYEAINYNNEASVVPSYEK